MSGKIRNIGGIGFVILVLMSILCTGCGKLTDRIEINAKRILPSRETSAEKRLKEPRIVVKHLQICRLVEIQFQDNQKRKVYYPGKVIYLNDKENVITKEFAYMSSINVLNPAQGNQTAVLPLEGLKKVRFETIPLTTLKKWPGNFEWDGQPIPRIRVEVEYTGGEVVRYSTYATLWIDFYVKELPSQKKGTIQK